MSEDCRRLIENLTTDEIRKYAAEVIYQNSFTAIMLGERPSARDLEIISRNLIAAGIPEEFITTPADIISISIQLKNALIKSFR